MPTRSTAPSSRSQASSARWPVGVVGNDSAGALVESAPARSAPESPVAQRGLPLPPAHDVRFASRTAHGGRSSQPDKATRRADPHLSRCPPVSCRRPLWGSGPSSRGDLPSITAVDRRSSEYGRCTKRCDLFSRGSPRAALLAGALLAACGGDSPSRGPADEATATPDSGRVSGNARAIVLGDIADDPAK